MGVRWLVVGAGLIAFIVITTQVPAGQEPHQIAELPIEFGHTPR